MLRAGAYRRHIENRYVPATPASLEWRHDLPRTSTNNDQPASAGSRVAGLLVAIAAIAAALGFPLPAYLVLDGRIDTATSFAVSSVMRSAKRGRAPCGRHPARPRSSETGQSQIQAGPNQHAAAIASVAKVMTAYLVLRDHPLRLGEDGPTITLTDADVADTDRRRGQEESVVSIAAGEQLTERQALQALLLPSANNIAAVLARWDAGSVGRFVARMNATARSLGMTHTRYTDPSGYDDATVSTAADQVRIVDRAMRLPVFASIVATPSATLPVAGTVHNTDTIARARRVCRRQDRLGPTRPAAASPSGPSAGSTASGRRSPGSCWASPATTRSRRVSRPPTPWSTASPVGSCARFRQACPDCAELPSPRP